jgi:RNA polymerase sigma factor (sigma-70 family)
MRAFFFGKARMDSAIDDLILAARDGDRAAQQRLYAICLPKMRRWARGWLTQPLRGINDADDLVQIALMRTWRRLGEFDVRCTASFYGYLRRVLLNEVRAEMRRCSRRGVNVACDETLSDGGDPAVEQLIAVERERAFAQAVRRLNRHQRNHFDMRIGMGMSFVEIAARTGGSADSARMFVTRMLRSLTEQVAAA